MIAAARRQNYAAAALVSGPRRPPCMVDYCVYFCYRAVLALITALPLRLVFFLGNGLGFAAWAGRTPTGTPAMTPSPTG